MILITGGAGFIGSNLLYGLEERGYHNVVICDDFGTSDKWQNICKREINNIIRPDQLKDFLQENGNSIDIVIHSAATISTIACDVDIVNENNFVLSRYLSNWCGQNDVRFIYLSSYSAYGDGNGGFRDDEDIQVIKNYQPLSPYGWSKHLFDRYMVRQSLCAKQDQGIRVPPQWVGLKLFNVYGPNEYHKEEQMSVICKLYPQVIAGAAARLFKSYHKDYEDGGQMRDFVYIDDVIDVILWFYDNPGVNGLYNVGSGRARTFNDMAGAVFKAANIEQKINYVDMSDSLRGRYQYFTQADISKLRAAGYVREFKDLETGVHRFINEYLSQTDPYK